MIKKVSVSFYALSYLFGCLHWYLTLIDGLWWEGGGPWGGGRRDFISVSTIPSYSAPSSTSGARYTRERIWGPVQ